MGALQLNSLSTIYSFNREFKYMLAEKKTGQLSSRVFFRKTCRHEPRDTPHHGLGPHQTTVRGQNKFQTIYLLKFVLRRVVLPRLGKNLPDRYCY